MSNYYWLCMLSSAEKDLFISGSWNMKDNTMKSDLLWCCKSYRVKMFHNYCSKFLADLRRNFSERWYRSLFCPRFLCGHISKTWHNNCLRGQRRLRHYFFLIFPVKNGGQKLATWPFMFKLLRKSYIACYLSSTSFLSLLLLCSVMVLVYRSTFFSGR